MEMYVNSFEPEERSGHLVSSQIKKLWNIQLILATELLAVCKKHNLKILSLIHISEPTRQYS